MYRHECKHDAANVSSNPARTPPATRQTERRARALARRARRAATAARRAAQQQQQRRAAVPRSVKGRGDSCTYMDVIEITAVTHSSSTTSVRVCEYPSSPRPVKGRGYSCANMDVKGRTAQTLTHPLPHGTGRGSNHSVPRPVRGRGYSRTNVNANKGVSRKRPLIYYQLWFWLGEYQLSAIPTYG